MIYKSNFISLSKPRLFKSFKSSRKLSKGYKFRKMKRIVGNISGVPTNTHLSNFTTSHTKTSDLLHASYGFGNQDVVTSSEHSHGFYSWID